MGRVWTHYKWILQKYAEEEFGAGSRYVEEALRATRAKLLAPEAPDYPHFLDTAMQVLRNECRSIKLRLEREEQGEANRRESPLALYDSMLGALDHETAEVVNELSPKHKQVLLLAAQGLSPAAIADLLGIPRSTVRARLSRGRSAVLAELERRRAKLEAVAIPVLSMRAGEGKGPTASTSVGLLLDLCHKATTWPRSAVSRSAELLGKAASSPHFAAAGLMAIVVGFGPSTQGQFVGPGGMGTSHGPRTATTVQTTAPAAAASSAPQIAAVSTAEPGAHPVQASRPEQRTLPGAPDDVRITAAAEPPAGGAPAVVAMGDDRSCQCPVLLRSLDGGITWATATAPPAGVTQLVVPPDYPTDPRIFAGTDPYSGLSPMVASSFGAAFEPLSDLPAGQIAVSANFGRRDSRLSVASLSGVWSVNADGPSSVMPRLDIAYASTTFGSVAALATPPPSATGPDLLAWVPSVAVEPGNLPSSGNGPALMACTSAGMCSPRAGLPSTPWRLVIGSDGSTVVAYTPSALYLSRDQGGSFVPVALPTGSASAAYSVFSAAVVGGANDLWVSFTYGRGARVESFTASGWADELGGDPVLQEQLAGALLPVGRLHILDALPNAGYRCTSIAAVEWLPRCPAA